jgi:uncharacterized protein
MALDVGSGAVHALDELALEALKLWNSMDRQTIAAQLSKRFDPKEVEETLSELDELEKMGQLNAPDDYGDVDVLSPGVVKAMCLHAAHDCNLRCKYCFAGAGEYHGRNRCMLSFETGKKALDWLVSMSGSRVSLEVDFFGGEPLMNFDVVKELVAYGRSLEEPFHKKFKFTTTTNGLNLNDEIIDFLNREMDNVVISIDGRPEVHDRMRPTPNGRGSYEHIVPNALKLARSRNQQRYYIRGTFTAHNLDFSRDVLHLADTGFEQLSIEPVVADPSCDYALSEKDLPKIMDEYEILAREYLKRRHDGRWFNFFHFMVDLAGGPCLRKRLTGCGAGNEYVAVTPEGDIYPCHQFVGREGFLMGSVLDGSFNREIQQKFAANHVLSKPACKSCWARFFCSGGCAANAHAFHGDISSPYDLECQMERKRLECAMALYALEQES